MGWVWIVKQAHQRGKHVCAVMVDAVEAVTGEPAEQLRFGEVERQLRAGLGLGCSVWMRACWRDFFTEDTIFLRRLYGQG